MKIINYAAIMLVPFTQLNCDLSIFPWGCDIPVQLYPSTYSASQAYCGNLPVYLTAIGYNQLIRYTRADVNMVLRRNGEYMDSPCLPGQK